eukprot:scaffold118358_cov15-Tisochrysis_lutea.AAC.1
MLHLCFQESSLWCVLGKRKFSREQSASLSGRRAFDDVPEEEKVLDGKSEAGCQELRILGMSLALKKDARDFESCKMDV